MGKGPRNYSDLTIKRLYSLAGNQCSYPECSVIFTNAENVTNFSNICHIAGAKKDSERYDSKMTDRERADYENLILLCANHHITTNDEEKFKVSTLKHMKRNHENDIAKKIDTTNILNKYPSSLAIVINHISSVNLDTVDSLASTNTYSPNKKITYNEVVVYKPILEQYKVYHGKLNKIYSEIEKQGSFKKELLLQNINTLYLRAKGEILGADSGILKVRENADNLIRLVEKYLWDLYEKSPNAHDDIPFEAVNIGMQIIIVDAFVRCKILEEPI
ncbi:hypothetical protein N9954_07935 [Maribacter sp.]|nr:hypothetical protein [Maribacter sp.]